eukprot:TRINITY_DN64981_c0_g2_i1.p1 TRINITY_DN64981_c0_g2~~TRINITY_DN64981_c0_g2_i1.p1  ORF type:complete len:523 (+),score=47.18 TRINITY_DN64981_c0_g2_i1:1386-2954(+)
MSASATISTDVQAASAIRRNAVMNKMQILSHPERIKNVLYNEKTSQVKFIKDDGSFVVVRDPGNYSNVTKFQTEGRRRRRCWVCNAWKKASNWVEDAVDTIADVLDSIGSIEFGFETTITLNPTIVLTGSGEYEWKREWDDLGGQIIGYEVDLLGAEFKAGLGISVPFEVVFNGQAEFRIEAPFSVEFTLGMVYDGNRLDITSGTGFDIALETPTITIAGGVSLTATTGCKITFGLKGKAAGFKLEAETSLMWPTFSASVGFDAAVTLLGEAEEDCQLKGTLTCGILLDLVLSSELSAGDWEIPIDDVNIEIDGVVSPELVIEYCYLNDDVGGGFDAELAAAYEMYQLVDFSSVYEGSWYKCAGVELEHVTDLTSREQCRMWCVYTIGCVAITWRQTGKDCYFHSSCNSLVKASSQDTTTYCDDMSKIAWYKLGNVVCDTSGTHLLNDYTSSTDLDDGNDSCARLCMDDDDCVGYTINFSNGDISRCRTYKQCNERSTANVASTLSYLREVNWFDVVDGFPP